MNVNMSVTINMNIEYMTMITNEDQTGYEYKRDT
jgi:hypothetical protein